MQAVHFAILPYRSTNNTIDPDWVRLVLITTSGTVITSREIPKDNWKDDTNGCRAFWKCKLLSEVKDLLLKASNNHGYIYNESKRLLVDDDTYNDWYRWYYFINGEDAKEFIDACGHSQHSTHWQTRCGVTFGWKYFKALKERNFRTNVAAMFAYTRGYLTGMELNAPWDHEGLEVLSCLGLTTISDDPKALMELSIVPSGTLTFFVFHLLNKFNTAILSKRIDRNGSSLATLHPRPESRFWIRPRVSSLG